MTTIVEALQTATDELHTAAVLMQTLAGQVQADLASTTTTATTIVNNYVNRPPSIRIYVDPVNGDDANDGSTIALAKRDIDAVLGAPRDRWLQLILLNDAVVARRYSIYSTVSIIGAIAGLGSFGEAFVITNRKISFAPEASNSPLITWGRSAAGWFMFAPWIETISIDFKLPDAPAALDLKSHLLTAGGVTVIINGGSISALTNTASNVFLQVDGVGTLAFYGTIGANGAGRIFLGIPAGANPNASFGYRSNLTAA